jgi:D-arabinose 1-dehydrogenase-like Zn-dependent alcohol dehydrogenase
MISKEELKKLVENVMFTTGKNQEELALDLGYGKNYISEMTSPTGKVSTKFVNAFKQKHRGSLENPKVQGVGNFGKKEDNTALLDLVQHLTKTNDSLIQQHDKIVNANMTIAETNRMLAEQLIKERPIASDVVYTQKETVAIVKVLQEHVIDLEAQLTKRSVREIQQEFYNKVKEVKDPV